MSPRAAWRLESLGFTDVCDYVAGKHEWLAMGLPTQGTNAGVRRLKDVVLHDLPRCALAERVHDVAERVRSSRWDIAIVLNDEDVVLGVLGRKALASASDTEVETEMTTGPSTFRPHVSVEEMAHYVEHNDVTTVIVTRSDGTFMGAVRREDLQRG
jgi:signal-transduction protein with cAMP-binding, CBS, and nucleotidyltransferase domain